MSAHKAAVVTYQPVPTEFWDPDHTHAAVWSCDDSEARYRAYLYADGLPPKFDYPGYAATCEACRLRSVEQVLVEVVDG